MPSGRVGLSCHCIHQMSDPHRVIHDLHASTSFNTVNEDIADSKRWAGWLCRTVPCWCSNQQAMAEMSGKVLHVFKPGLQLIPGDIFVLSR